MRRILDIKDILVSAIGVIPDTIVFIIAHTCGCPLLLSLILSLLPSTFLVKPLSKLVEKLIGVGKRFAVIIVVLTLVLSGWAFLVLAEENIWIVLPIYVLPCVIISIMSTLLVTHRIRKAEERVIRDFEETEGEVSMNIEEARQIIDGLKGDNREIIGKYPKKDAAVCENGTFVGKRINGVLAFKGIPYAQAPIGELRWRQPQRVKPSENVFEAYYYGKAEPQPFRNYSEASLYDMSEDCLTLNIWKSGKTRKKCPVIVWIDTIDWCTGGTASVIKSGDEFVRDNPEIIYVNMNFRLGLFSNMDFSDVPGGEAYKDVKNLGLNDIIEALRWIQRNIDAFGGDPSNVTLVGGKGGGTATVLLALNKEANGLFRRVADFGGSLTFINDNETFRESQMEVRELLNAKTMEEFLQLPADRLAGVLNEIDSYFIGFPVSDGKTIPIDCRESIADASALDIDLLVCIAADEAGLLMSISGDKQNLNNQFRERVIDKYNSLPEQQKQCIEEYIDEHYQSDPDSLLTNCRMKTDLYFHFPMLKFCQAYANACGKGRYMIWDIKSPVKEIGSSFLITSLVLRNRKEFYEDCGVTGDPLVFSAVRRMLVNFAKTGDPSLKYGEIKNVGEQIFPIYDDADGSVTVLTENGLEQDGGELSRRIKQLETIGGYIY